MKKHFLLATAFVASFLFTQVTALAQETPGNPGPDSTATLPVTESAFDYPVFTFGPRLGINFSNVNFSGGNENTETVFGNTYKVKEDLKDDRENFVGFQAGAFFNIAFNKLFSLQPEIVYTQKGARFTGANRNFETDVLDEYVSVVKLNYLEIPVLAKVTFGSDSSNFFITAGPAVSYLLSGHERYRISGKTTEQDAPFAYNDETFAKYNRLDATVYAGIGFTYASRIGRFSVEGRYGYGLLDLIDYKEKPEGIAKVSNRTISLLASYNIALGRNK